jgi:hypothetical protein
VVFLTRSEVHGNRDLRIPLRASPPVHTLLPNLLYVGNLRPLDPLFEGRTADIANVVKASRAESCLRAGGGAGLTASVGQLLEVDRVGRVNVVGIPAIGKSEFCAAVAAWLLERRIVTRVRAMPARCLAADAWPQILHFVPDGDVPRDELALLELARNLFDLGYSNMQPLVEQRQQVISYLRVRVAAPSLCRAVAQSVRAGAPVAAGGG